MSPILHFYISMYITGRPHRCNVWFCESEKEPVSLIRHRLWPASPVKPKVAFTFDLLDWLEALQLESHLSTKGFCNGLRWRNPKYTKNLVSYVRHYDA